MVKFLLQQAGSDNALTNLPVASYLLNWIEHSNRQHNEASKESSPSASTSTSFNQLQSTESAVLASLSGNKGITAFSDKYFVSSWNFYCRQLLDKTKQKKPKKTKATKLESLALASLSPGLSLGGGSSQQQQIDRHDEVLAGPEPYDPRHSTKGLHSGAVTLPPHSSIATDGSYLYILDSLGLAKVGTGHNNTIQV